MTGETMHAIRMHAFGGPEVLTEEEIPRPKPGAGEVLVRVRAAGVNPFEWKVRKGAFPSAVQLPATPGTEFAGTVEVVGAGVNGFRPGQDVFGVGASGAYAEYIIGKPAALADKPSSLDYIQAAAVPVGATTAWQALFDHGKLQAGQTVLIHGAAGAVGLFAVQLAKWKGATVIGTGSSKNAEFVRSLGADTFVAYDRQRFEDVVHDVDLVVDTVGGETQQRSFAVLKRGGTLIALPSPPSQDLATRFGVRAEWFSSQASAALLQQFAKLVDDKTIRPVVAEVLPLSEAGRAQDDSEHNHHAPGKIVLRVD
ncbi:MAG TPA: NADP-dependent oxidoreductase [Gemmatimonadaceae bacterium]|jgi:NADPH:quinone reductase-like Zn-dependent oxidoreductase|nr:NADP-dependent oxidoreductase [Gemmatimonadaceae bacterium]